VIDLEPAAPLSVALYKAHWVTVSPAASRAAQAHVVVVSTLMIAPACMMAEGKTALVAMTPHAVQPYGLLRRCTADAIHAAHIRGAALKLPARDLRFLEVKLVIANSAPLTIVLYFETAAPALLAVLHAQWGCTSATVGIAANTNVLVVMAVVRTPATLAAVSQT